MLTKSAEQQAQGMVLKVRETLVGRRTQLVNALRGHAAEFGVIATKGINRVASRGYDHSREYFAQSSGYLRSV